jgi:hypothetical protein
MADTDGVQYKGKAVCWLHVDGTDELPGPWTVWVDAFLGPDGEQKGLALPDCVKETAWAHINLCGSCGGNCAPGSTKTLFGKTFDKVCGVEFAFTDPDAGVLDCIKTLLTAKKAAIDAEG